MEKIPHLWYFLTIVVQYCEQKYINYIQLSINRCYNIKNQMKYFLYFRIKEALTVFFHQIIYERAGSKGVFLRIGFII